MSIREPETEEQTAGSDLGGQMSFLDHLEELRNRIIRSLIAVGLAFVACWTFVDELFDFISRPIKAVVPKLAIFSPTEAFNLSLKTALVASLFLASPFIMAQVWLFIAPGLYKHERRYAGPFVIFSTLLFVAGGTFAYMIAFPFAVTFLIQWARDMGMETTINASEYFDLFLTIIVALGIVFEIPAVIFVLSRMGLVTAGFLLRNTKYAVLISFLVAAIITPTSDVPNMMIMAVPMIVLYLLGIFVALVFAKKRTKETA